MNDAPTVLVVDDDPDIRDLIQLGLEDEGYRVLAVPHGEAEIEAAGHLAKPFNLSDLRDTVARHLDVAD